MSFPFFSGSSSNPSFGSLLFLKVNFRFLLSCQNCRCYREKIFDMVSFFFPYRPFSFLSWIFPGESRRAPSRTFPPSVRPPEGSFLWGQPTLFLFPSRLLIELGPPPLLIPGRGRRLPLDTFSSLFFLFFWFLVHGFYYLPCSFRRALHSSCSFRQLWPVFGFLFAGRVPSLSLVAAISLGVGRVFMLIGKLPPSSPPQGRFFCPFLFGPPCLNFYFLTFQCLLVVPLPLSSLESLSFTAFHLLGDNLSFQAVVPPLYCGLPFASFSASYGRFPWLLAL